MNDAEAIVGQLNRLVEELERYPDPELREKALDLAQMILALHGEVLRRMLVTLGSLPGSEPSLAEIMKDEVVRGVLLIHGLAREDLQTSVAATLEYLRPGLIAQGCDVKLLSVENGRAKIRLMRSGKGAPPISALKIEIEKALLEASPELLEIEIEGLAEQIESTAKAAAILGSMIPARNGDPQPSKLVQIKRKEEVKKDARWVSVIRAVGFEEGRVENIDYAGLDLLISRIDGDFYAYRDLCPAGNDSLAGAVFESPMLICDCHGYHYNLQRRGFCAEKPDLRLESLPVKIEDDKIKVAL